MMQLCRVSAEDRHTFQKLSRLCSLLNKLQYCRNHNADANENKSVKTDFWKPGFLHILINFENHSGPKMHFC